MNRLNEQLDMLIAEADFQHAKEELEQVQEELRQAVSQQLQAIVSYNVIFPVTYPVQNEYLFN